MLLYAITQRDQLPGTDADRRATLVALAREWAQAGADYIQIREKDLPVLDLLALAQEIVAEVRAARTQTRVLLNGPAEAALDAGADGVHLPSNAGIGSAEKVRGLFADAGKRLVVSRSCHTIEDVRAVREDGDGDPLILYAPVFEKITPDRRISGRGLEALHHAVEAAGPIPVIALGGVTVENAQSCVTAGAVGVAGIRLFLSGGWRTLR